jgi:hypothetical protein
MTERDPQTGQFTDTPAEPEVGKIAELHQSGYKTLDEHTAEQEEPKVYGSDVKGLREAADDHDFKKMLAANETQVDVTALQPEALPDDVALDAKQAAERDHQHREAERRVGELNTTKSEAMKILEDLGYDPDQSEAEWQRFFQAHVDAQQPQGEPLHQIVEQPQQQPVDPQQEARELIERNPVLRQAVEQEISKAQAMQAQYAQAATQAAHLAYHDLVRDAQELRRQGFDSFEKLAKENPQKALEYQAKTERVKTLIAEHDRVQHHQRAHYQAAIAHGERQADALMVQRHPELAQRSEMEKAKQQIRDLFVDYGMDGRALPPELRANPSVHEFLLQMARMHAGQKQLKAAQREAARPKAPVQRPGVSTPPPPRMHQELADIDRQLKTAKGDKAVRLAARRFQLRQGR